MPKAPKKNSRAPLANLPPESPREAWERSETNRLLSFLEKYKDTANGRPWPIPDLRAVIESDNGRFRLWLEIREGMSLNTIMKNWQFLSNWKSRLVEEEGPDPLPHPIDTIVAQYRGTNGRPALGPSEVARDINRWVMDSLHTWENASSQSRGHITRDLLAVLMLFGITRTTALRILDRAQEDVRQGRRPFQRSMEHRNASSRAPYPITTAMVKSKLRTWAR